MFEHDLENQSMEQSSAVEVTIQKLAHDGMTYLSMSTAELLARKVPEEVVKQAHIAQEREGFLFWIKETHQSRLYELLGNPTRAQAQGWPDNRVLAEAAVNGNATAEQKARIQEKLIEGETVESWAAKVVFVKAPYTEFASDVAEGLLRKYEKLGEEASFDGEHGYQVFDALKAEVATDLEAAKVKVFTKLEELKSALAS